MMRHVADVLSDIPGVRIDVGPSGVYARPPITPVCFVYLDEAATGRTRAEVVRDLLEGEPSIAVGTFDGGLVVNPLPMVPGEETIVASRLRAVLTSTVTAGLKSGAGSPRR
jgi:hypothetical protein